MAGSRTTQTALTIALSIFVMLAFALGVTTYMYFDKAEKAELTRSQATADAARSETKARETVEEMNRLRAIVGVAEDVKVEDIELQFNALVQNDFQGLQGTTATYLELLRTVRDSFRDKNLQVKTVEEEKKTLAAQKDAEVASAEKAKQDAIAAEQQAAAQRDKEKADFDDRWKAHEAEQQKVMDARRAAEERAREMEGIKAEVEKGLDYMPPNRQAEYRAAIEAGDLIKQLDLLRFELRGRAKDIDNLNAILSRLRVADPELQKIIAEARPENDRIDGFKGHVVSVDPRTSTALVSCRTTIGLRPGLILHVFPPNDPKPEFGTRKGVLEISDIEGPTLVRTIVRREDQRNPILSGDGVSSSLWSGGVEPKIVIVGFADVDSDGGSDLAALSTIVERAGGTIVDAVAPNTALVVDLGQPPSGQELRDVPGWPAEAKRRTRNLDSARTYNIRVTGIDGLLDMLGLDAESFRPGRLPKARGGVGRLPDRS
jgi:hypothetical protein